MAFLSGPYFWSFAPVGHVLDSPIPTPEQISDFALGVVEDAPTFRFSREGDPITGDNLGAAIQGVVDRGGNLFIDMILQELNGDAALRTWWPYDPHVSNPALITDGIPDQLGRVGTATQRSIGRLTPTFELRATKFLNATDIADDVDEPGVGRLMYLLRFQNAQIAPGFDIAQLLGSRLRNVPISFLCSPFSSGNDTVFWTQS